MSTATLVETSIVIEARYGAEGLRDLDLLIAKAQIDLVPVDVEQAHGARLAFSLYGKGATRPGSTTATASPTRLAKVIGLRLLYKGDDFSRTDIGAVTGSVD